MLCGRRSRLRAIEEADLPLIAQWRSDPEVYAYFYEYEPLSIKQQQAWYEKQLGSGNEKNFVIALPDGKAVGMVSLVHIDMRNRRAEFGRWLIGDREHRRSGLGFEGAALVLQYAFEHLNLNRVDLEVLAGNTNAARKNLELGFREEGVKRQFVYKAGAYQDVRLMAMLRSDYDRALAEGPLGKVLQGQL